MAWISKIIKQMKSHRSLLRMVKQIHKKIIKTNKIKDQILWHQMLNCTVLKILQPMFSHDFFFLSSQWLQRDHSSQSNSCWLIKQRWCVIKPGTTVFMSHHENQLSLINKPIQNTLQTCHQFEPDRRISDCYQRAVTSITKADVNVQAVSK